MNWLGLIMCLFGSLMGIIVGFVILYVVVMSQLRKQTKIINDNFQKTIDNYMTVGLSGLNNMSNSNNISESLMNGNKTNLN